VDADCGASGQCRIPNNSLEPCNVMPPDRSGNPNLALLPEKLFQLANDHERQQMNQYRRLAFRFLTFGQGVSRLMAILGIECEQRLDRQRQAARRLAWLDTHAGHEAHQGMPSSISGQGLLITNRDLAIEALAEAIARAEDSRRFSECLRDGNAISELHPMLASFVEQKRAEYRILLDAREMCECWVPQPEAVAMAEHAIGHHLVA
jgi:hypothetical protein